MKPFSRREFLALSGAILPLTLVAAHGAQPATLAAPALGTPEALVPWHQRVRRIGQLNFNERDPAELDVEAWADYWASVAVDAVLISVTGIIAFYPTDVPFHRRSRFLGTRDLFGTCVAAAKKRGLRAIARLSPDLAWDDAVTVHPDWFMRDSHGALLPHNEEPHLLRTCMFSRYFTEQIPAIMREVQARYEVDALYTNGWPALGGLPVCFCEACRRLAPPNSPDYWEQYTARTLELWKLYDRIAKEKKSDNLFFANLGGGLRAAPNLARLMGIAQWFNSDNQGRGGEASPIWGAAQQGRVATAVMKGRTITNVLGSYSTGGNALRWRNSAKSAEESEIWMDQIVASGMTIWYHWIGGQTGLGEDHRWQEIGRKYLQWHQRHERHFVRRRSLANIAVVMGQRTHQFYTPPGEGTMQEFADGLYSALLENRCFFDFVHEDDLGPETIGRYTALLLPNIAWLSDLQCRQLADYAAAGGSLIASFETALFDEKGGRRANSGLAKIFGIESTGAAVGPNGNGFYARIERSHEILNGFADTSWLPGGAWRLPVKSAAVPVLSVVPSYTAYPPEMSYDPIGKTDGPAVVLRETGASRGVYFPGDIERAAWRSGNTDLVRLLRNALTWVTRGEEPVQIQGKGLVECFAWETVAGFAVHVLNYTNPNAHRGWLREFYPIGELRVRVEIPAGRKVTRIELLRSERDIPFREQGSRIEFTIPTVVDYEVAALYA